MSTKNPRPTPSRRLPAHRPVRSVSRSRLSAIERRSAVAEIGQTLTERLEAEHAALVRKTELLAAAGAPMTLAIESDARAVRARGQLARLYEVERKAQLKGFRDGAFSGALFNLQLTPGIEVIAPPYDLQWHTALSQASKANGSFNVAAILGYEAAAVGVELSSVVAAAISFRPVVSFKYLWVNSALQGPCSSRGGLGILVYRNGEAVPALDRRRLLWDDHRDAHAPLGKGSGDGYFATEFSPGDVLLQMEAGDRVRIWMWCWSIAHTVSAADRMALSTGYVECRMPFIVVDTGPPLPPVR